MLDAIATFTKLSAGINQFAGSIRTLPSRRSTGMSRILLAPIGRCSFSARKGVAAPDTLLQCYTHPPFSYLLNIHSIKAISISIDYI